MRQQELRDAFADGWVMSSITAATFAINPGLPTPGVKAWLATIRRALTWAEADPVTAHSGT